MIEYLQVGSINKPHGIKGEMKVFPTTDDLNRFDELASVYIEKRDGFEERKIEGVKYFKNMVILKLEGIDRIEEAELLRNRALFVPRNDAADLDEDTFYIGDLIGMDVYLEDGSRFGVLTEVLETGANDVYEIKREKGDTVLIPAIKDCVRDVDVSAGRMTIHLLPGLIEEEK